MAVSSLLRHIAALTLGAVLVSLLYGEVAASDHGSVVCSIPVGPDGVHYRNVDTPDELAWGPKSFAIDRRGNFYILDTVADRILVYSRDCRRLRSILLPPGLVGAKDLEVADGFWVLDAAALTPTVYRLSLRGAVLGKYPSPIGLSDGLSGISLANDGSVQVEAHFGFMTVPLLTGRAGNGLAPRPIEGFSRRGVRYRTEISSDSPNEGVIAVGDKRIAIREASALSTLRIVHLSDDNRIYAAVGANGADETLRQYRADGTLLRSAVLPKQEFIYVDRNVRVDSRGGAYVVVALPERLEIRRLRFSSRAVSRTTERPQATAPSRPVVLSPAAGKPIDSPKACLVFRPNQIETAKRYINSKTLITKESIATFCEGRIKPRYLTGEARYSSVPYAWGEWDTVPVFKDHMFNQEQAGDINTSKAPKVPRACGRGIDCSGLVSRAWGRTEHKWRTVHLNENSYPVDSVGSVQRVRQGDILLKNDKHVMIFDTLNKKAGTVMVYEATTDGKIDRVIHHSRPVSQIASRGYAARRFNFMCDYVDVSIACDGQSPALFVDDLEFNFRGSDDEHPFQREKTQGKDYDGDPIWFRTTARYDRHSNDLRIDIAMYSNAQYNEPFRTDRCLGKWNDAKSTAVFDEKCKLIKDNGAGCPVVRVQMKIDETGNGKPIGANALVRLGEKYGVQLLGRR